MTEEKNEKEGVIQRINVIPVDQYTDRQHMSNNYIKLYNVIAKGINDKKRSVCISEEQYNIYKAFEVILKHEFLNMSYCISCIEDRNNGSDNEFVFSRTSYNIGIIPVLPKN